jgi:hypothetical protein
MRSLRTRTAPADEPATTRTDERAATRAERPAAGAGAAAVGARAAGGLFLTLAWLVRAAAGVAVVLIVLGIILFDLKANPGNSIVSGIHDAANWLTNPFHGLFSVHGARKTLSINWGIAAVVYLIAGGIIASIIASPARFTHRFRRY